MGALAFRDLLPVLNAIFMNLAWLFAPKGAELSALHIGSVYYALANTLSRLAEGAVLPPLLLRSPRVIRAAMVSTSSATPSSCRR